MKRSSDRTGTDGEAETGRRGETGEGAGAGRGAGAGEGEGTGPAREAGEGEGSAADARRGLGAGSGGGVEVGREAMTGPATEVGGGQRAAAARAETEPLVAGSPAGAEAPVAGSPVGTGNPVVGTPVGADIPAAARATETPAVGNPVGAETPVAGSPAGAGAPVVGSPVGTGNPVVGTPVGTGNPAGAGAPVGADIPAAARAGTETPVVGSPVGAETPVADIPVGGGADGASVGAGVSGGGGEGARGWRGRWLRRVALAVVVLLLGPVVVAQAALRVNYMGDPADGTYTRGKDALWLGHAWVDGRKGDADVKSLAGRLRDTGIRDLYVHAGPLEHDGTLPRSAYANARWFIAAVHREAPKLRVQAWLGDVLASESPDGMRLERAETRAAVVRSAGEILAAGFQGAHFDLEPLHSGDADYLTLLDSLRAVTRAHDAQLSVAAHQIDPVPGFHSFWGTTTGHPKWWSQRFFGQVARRVDQIAVMSYDTMQPLESTYGGYVAQQTSLALEVTPPGTDLLMGLPFYKENRFGHWAHAETVAAAVRGVRLGLSRTDADRENFGVAAYVDFTATETDWASYEEGWVR